MLGYSDFIKCVKATVMNWPWIPPLNTAGNLTAVKTQSPVIMKQKRTPTLLRLDSIGEPTQKPIEKMPPVNDTGTYQSGSRFGYPFSRFIGQNMKNNKMDESVIFSYKPYTSVHNFTKNCSQYPILGTVMDHLHNFVPQQHREFKPHIRPHQNLYNQRSDCLMSNTAHKNTEGAKMRRLSKPEKKHTVSPVTSVVDKSKMSCLAASDLESSEVCMLSKDLGDLQVSSDTTRDNKFQGPSGSDDSFEALHSSEIKNSHQTSTIDTPKNILLVCDNKSDIMALGSELPHICVPTMKDCVDGAASCEVLQEDTLSEVYSASDDDKDISSLDSGIEIPIEILDSSDPSQDQGGYHNKAAARQQPNVCTPTTTKPKRKKSRPSSKKRKRRRKQSSEAFVQIQHNVEQTPPSSRANSMVHKLDVSFNVPKKSACDNTSTTSSKNQCSISLQLGASKSCDNVENSKPSLSFCARVSFVISPSPSDSGDDSVDWSDDDDEDLMMSLAHDDVALDLLNSLSHCDPYSPFNLGGNCIKTTPIMTKSSSAPELTKSSTLPRINEQWNRCYTSQECVAKSPKKHKVQFSEAEPEVHHIIQWDYAYRAARKGPWEQYALDRCRFKTRIQEVETKIGYVFEDSCREAAYIRLQQQPAS